MYPASTPRGRDKQCTKQAVEGYDLCALHQVQKQRGHTGKVRDEEAYDFFLDIYMLISKAREAAELVGLDWRSIARRLKSADASDAEFIEKFVAVGDAVAQKVEDTLVDLAINGEWEPKISKGTIATRKNPITGRNEEIWIRRRVPEMVIKFLQSKRPETWTPRQSISIESLSTEQLKELLLDLRSGKRPD